jgi:mono/diheme cytochrome c family protein
MVGGFMGRSNSGSILGAGLVFTGLLAAQMPGKVDFRRDIRPLFQEKCMGCHGPAQQMGGMRLDHGV